jgi:hypothetical protein
LKIASHTLPIMRTTERKAVLRQIFRNDVATPVDALIDAVLDEMHREGVNSEEYPKLMSYLERLYEMKAKDRQPPLSRDTLALIGGNLLGILLIVAYEQKHVMTSKGLSQIIRPR